jgi:hypothetical protein
MGHPNFHPIISYWHSHARLSIAIKTHTLGLTRRPRKIDEKVDCGGHRLDSATAAIQKVQY